MNVFDGSFQMNVVKIKSRRQGPTDFIQPTKEIKKLFEKMAKLFKNKLHFSYDLAGTFEYFLSNDGIKIVQKIF